MKRDLTGLTVAELLRRDDVPPQYRVWIATRPGVLDHVTLVRFACFCAKQVWDQLDDERSRRAVETAEAFCRGEATREKCRAAANAAYAAYTAAHAANAAYAAAYAAYAAAYTAANAADAANAAYTAAYASYSAAYAAYAADADTRGEQVKWLHDHELCGF